MARRVRVRAAVIRRLNTLGRLDPAAADAVADAIALLGADLTARRLGRLGVTLRAVNFETLPGLAFHHVRRADRYLASRADDTVVEIADLI